MDRSISLLVRIIILIVLIKFLFVLLGCTGGGSGGGQTPQPTPIDQPTPSPTPPTPTPTPQPPAPGRPDPADPKFLVLDGGKDLRGISVSGSKLKLERGQGGAWTAAKQQQYLELKKISMIPDAKVQWVLMDLDSGVILAQSASPQKRIFGASSSKIFVAGALLDYQAGKLSDAQLQLMANMLVVSSNEAWTELQRQLGSGSADKGRERNFQFTQRNGYLKTLGFQGSWGSKHGNELTAMETTLFLRDTYQARYPGAMTLWKIMHTCRTGESRGRKYLPTTLIVGAKTGTYDGPTYDTDIGKNVNVAVRNHVMTFKLKGVQYGLTVLSNRGTDEDAAMLARGLTGELGLL